MFKYMGQFRLKSGIGCGFKTLIQQLNGFVAPVEGLQCAGVELKVKDIERGGGQAEFVQTVQGGGGFVFEQENFGG